MGDKKMVFTAPMIDSTSQHGTGCSYSSAITASLALGLNLKDALQKAKEFITHAIEQAPNIGHGPGPINHKAGGNHVS